MNLIPIRRDGSVMMNSDMTLPEVAQSVITATVQLYEQRGYVEPWIGYLAVEDGAYVGSCGFTSPPLEQVVEIAYFTFPDFERRGIATRMARQLVSIAQEADSAVRIIAHTLKEENASTRLLKKIGFVFSDAVDHPEDGNIWEWSYAQKSNPA